METRLTTTQDYIPMVTTKRVLIAVRESYPEFRHCQESERLNRLFLEIQYAAMMDGEDLTEKTLITIAREVGGSMMQGPASGLTYPEIRTAIRNGAAGQYGDWFKINVRTVLSWLDSFIEDNKATYRELAKQRDNERRSQMGEFYLEKVRRHAEEMAKKNKI